ncbi:GNAT family N-acetyltransferase [Candidatus Microgenomates bacterium]|nr:GNAT family N-acetyltransferase [Candidatus Microgenomates bacterium]
MNITIEFEKLSLVPISRNFADQIFQEFTDEITVFMYPKSPATIEETYDFIDKALQSMQNDQELQMVVIDKQTGEFLGCAGLHSINSETPELGIWIKKSAHGQKYGREAVTALVNWARENLNYKYLKYPVDKNNIASRKIPESLGGVVEDEYIKTTPEGKKLDEVEYRIYR